MSDKPEMPEPNWAPYLTERERPEEPVVMYQRWSELLFLHWAFEPSTIQAMLPEGLTVDVYDDRAWVGVVPFQMSGVRPRFLPSVPGLSNFPELNLRTYVKDQAGRPGVWFFSLDTPQRMANWIARTFFHLNYRRARFDVHQRGARLIYQSELKLESGWSAPENFEWERKGGVQKAEVGSLEFFLVERYRLFAFDWVKSKLFTGRVHHAPYPIESAEVIACSTHLFATNELSQPAGSPEHVMASGGVDVRVYPLRLVG